MITQTNPNPKVPRQVRDAIGSDAFAIQDLTQSERLYDAFQLTVKTVNFST